METLYSYGHLFFGWLLRNTFQASIIVCLILLIQALLRNRLTARWRYALWLILVVRMVLPWAPQSRISIYNFTTWQRKSNVPASVPSERNVEPVKTPGGTSVAPQTTAGPGPAGVAEGQNQPLAVPSGTSRIAADSATNTMFRLSGILPFLWLAGALALGGYIVICNLRLWRAARVECPSTDKETLELLEKCRAAIGLRTIVALVPSETINTPVLLGFVRPRLLVPKSMAEKLNREELRYVFLHELAHVKRHDIAIGWLTTLLQVVHWFNPFVWLAFHRMRSNRESACDAFVLSRMQGEETQRYGRAIVSLLEHFSVPQSLPGLAGILESKSQLKRRIAMITQFKNNSYRWSPLAIVLIIILACISLPEAKRTQASGISDAKPSAIMVRQVWTQAGDAYTPSPDGRYLSYINWAKQELAVHDLKTGENRNLTEEGTWNEPSEYPDRSVWSPDSRQVAYCWNKGKGNELRIVALDGSKPRVLCGSVPEGGHAPWPSDWSQDGKYILALLGKKDEKLKRGHEDHIVLVSVEDGSLRTLKSLGEQRTRNMSLSPDGRYVVFDLTTEDSEKRDICLLATDGSGEATLVEHPADDWAPFWAPDGRRIVFVSDRAGSPGLWLLSVDDGNPKAPPTLVKELGSNLGRPMGFTRDGSFYYDVMTPVNDVYVATLDFKAGKVLVPPTKISLRFEGWNYAPFWSPDGKYLAYASRRSFGTVFVIRDVESGQERDLSPKTTVQVLRRKAEATPRWSPDGASILFTAIDPSVKRHRLNLVDAESGNVTPIMPKVEGGEHTLTKWPVFSNDGKRIYYVRGDRSIVTCNLETQRERELYQTNAYIYRLALSPDSRRLAFFEAARAVRPTVVKTISASGGESSEIYTLKQGKRFSWGVGLSWTPDGDYVVVGGPEARDEPDVLWMIPAKGGEPRKLELGVKVSHLSLHPDGRRIAFTCPEPSGGDGGEVWMMEKFLPEAVAMGR